MRLQQVARLGGNVFEELMETVKVASLGQITDEKFVVENRNKARPHRKASRVIPFWNRTRSSAFTACTIHQRDPNRATPYLHRTFVFTYQRAYPHFLGQRQLCASQSFSLR